ncbi:MAG: hypothetical protein JXB33_06155 [Clostridia bacterium]|nr:hypothetical protein [Clostridia bacterium]
MDKKHDTYFTPGCTASWWCTLEDILWPEKKIIEKIKYTADSFAQARIETAINFGFHVRFDFSNYFSQLHGYYAAVCDELHKYGIRFMDHYSCNHVQRPRNMDEFKKVHRNHRHHILLFHDPQASAHAQYEGHFFNDLCETDIRDGSRGYSRNYQLEVFCHNNPGFLDMHMKYLARLLKEVPLDGIEVDDMCDYAGLATCGCEYCRERLSRDYGREIAPFGDESFWGDTRSRGEYHWGNYDNPAFRDWLKMKSDSVAGHLAMIKASVRKIPLMTCCSSSGPIILNSLALNLEKLSKSLDFFMLENCGINTGSVDWVRMDPEALQQKDIAAKRGDAPAMAISYSIYGDGAYLGWALARFWGVFNWSSTLNQRLEKDPDDAHEISELIGGYNNWEAANSDIDFTKCSDIAEVRIASNRYCRENGWRDAEGLEHWDKVVKWAGSLVENNIGYRIVRADELADETALGSSGTPLVLDGLACLSDPQFNAISMYLEKGGKAWISLPFGTHDENGFPRDKPCSDYLDKNIQKGLEIIETSTAGNPLGNLLTSGSFTPVAERLSGDSRWALRLRTSGSGNQIHLLNRALSAIPHPSLRDNSGRPILAGIESQSLDNKLVYRIDSTRFPMSRPELLSPELGPARRDVQITKSGRRSCEYTIDLDGIGIYAVVQEKPGEKG